MCYDEGLLQSYIDGELPAREAEGIPDHVSSCEECGSLYRRLLDNDSIVRNSMEVLLVSDRDRFNAELAWSKLKLEKIKYEEKKKGKWYNHMNYKKLVAAAAAVGVVAMLGFTPVRGMAAEFLTIFRVENVKTITITPEDMRQLESIMKDGAGGADIKNFGKIEVNGSQEVVAVTPEEARGAVDFDLKVPALEGFSGPSLKKMSGSSVTLAMDVDKVNAALKAFGSQESLPAELNGQEFTMLMPTGIMAEYSGQDGKIMLGQSRGPTVKTTSGVNVDDIRKALLSIPVLPENLKRQLAAVNDWQHTVLLPVRDGQATEVMVNGGSGVFISGRNHGGSGPSGALVWQSNGVINVLSGDNLNMEKAVDIAGKMK
ncbi:MAG: anti-sigma factor family protein [Desulfocucumaceae bacterium]